MFALIFLPQYKKFCIFELEKKHIKSSHILIITLLHNYIKKHESL
jgi:hypothetical protein